MKEEKRVTKNASGNKNKKRGNNAVRNVSKGILTLFLVAGILAICFGIYYVVTLVIDAHSFDITLYKTDMASTIYVEDGNGGYSAYEQLYSGERRVWVPIDKIPVHVQQAAVAIEDERFYAHHGVDLKRTMGAFAGWLTGRNDYGGSTITQQLIKNVTNEKDTTASRKAKEICRALVLETQLEKDEILEYYLNVVYFANSSYGIQTAAQTYFGKDASELTIAEGAAIVGITQAPSYYNPLVNPENNKEKQELVLGKMLELNFITQQEYNEAINQELVFQQDGTTRLTSEGGINSFFAEAMVKELIPELAEELNIPEEQAELLIYTGGLKIYSTMNPDVQNSIDKVFEDGDNEKLFPDPNKEGVANQRDQVQPEAAIVVISVEDGSVKGMYGQRGRKDANLVLNRATDTTRQPGSSIKPLAVYGPAIELGLVEPGSPVVDEAFSIPEKNWYPKNWYSGYKGTVSIQEAVVQSMNIPAIKTLQKVGVENSFDFVKNKLGLSTVLDPQDKDLAPLSLGGLTNGVTVLEMTAAYNAFAADGVYTEPYFYTKVLDRDGKVLLEKEVKSHRAFSKETSKKMTGILKATAQGSLGSPAAIPGHQSAGKTGTTNGDYDRWYMGYTTYYTAGVWHGYDIAETMPYYATRIVPHVLWRETMKLVHRDLPAKNFEGIYYELPEIQKYYLCAESGLVANEACPEKKEVLQEETVDKENCQLHLGDAPPAGETGLVEGGETVETLPEGTQQPAPEVPAEETSDEDTAMSRQ